MSSFSYIFRGEAASKKNSRRIVTVRGRPVPIPSKKYVAWEKYARQVILSSGRPGTPFPAATFYVQRSDNDRTDSRITAIEVRMDAGDKRMDASDRRSDKFGADIDNFKILLGDIRSDVSFIRGKLENMRGAK